MGSLRLRRSREVRELGVLLGRDPNGKVRQKYRDRHWAEARRSVRAGQAGGTIRVQAP